MAYAFFFMPGNASPDVAAPLNHFLSRHRVMNGTL